MYGSSFSPNYGSNWYGGGSHFGYGSNWGYNSPYSSWGYGASPYNGNWGYNQPNYYGGYNSAYGYPYNSGGFTYSPPVYSGTGYTSNGYATADTAQPYASGGYQSFYSGAGANANQVLLRIAVPSPDARVWIQGQPTQQMGTERVFISPPLAAGDYVYTLRSTWMANGREVSKEKQVTVRPGQETLVRFTESDADAGTTSTTTTTTGTGTTGATSTGTFGTGTTGTTTTGTGTTGTGTTGTGTSTTPDRNP